MSAKEMKALREAAGLTQAEMADRMDMGRSTYIDLEADDPDWKKFKPKHRMMLERLSLSLALERGDINLALPAMRRDALDLARLIQGEGPWRLSRVDYDRLAGYMRTVLDGVGAGRSAAEAIDDVMRPLAAWAQGEKAEWLQDLVRREHDLKTPA